MDNVCQQKHKLFSGITEFELSSWIRHILIRFTRFYLQIMGIIIHDSVNGRQLFYMMRVKFIWCEVISLPGDMKKVGILFNFCHVKKR